MGFSPGQQATTQIFNICEAFAFEHSSCGFTAKAPLADNHDLPVCIVFNFVNFCQQLSEWDVFASNIKRMEFQLLPDVYQLHRLVHLQPLFQFVYCDVHGSIVAQHNVYPAADGHLSERIA